MTFQGPDIKSKLRFEAGCRANPRLVNKDLTRCVDQGVGRVRFVETAQMAISASRCDNEINTTAATPIQKPWP
jgi:hypothetical protein